MIHSEDDWCTPGMKEAPYYFEGMTPEQYEEERIYLADHIEEYTAGTYKPIYNKGRVKPPVYSDGFESFCL